MKPSAAASATVLMPEAVRGGHEQQHQAVLPAHLAHTLHKSRVVRVLERVIDRLRKHEPHGVGATPAQRPRGPVAHVAELARARLDASERLRGEPRGLRVRVRDRRGRHPRALRDIAHRDLGARHAMAPASRATYTAELAASTPTGIGTDVSNTVPSMGIATSSSEVFSNARGAAPCERRPRPRGRRARPAGSSSAKRRRLRVDRGGIRGVHGRRLPSQVVRTISRELRGLGKPGRRR